MNSTIASRQSGAEPGWLEPADGPGAVWRATGTPVTPASLAAHGFLRGIPRELLAELAPAASLVQIPARCRLFEDGGRAANFWLIRSGSVAVDLHVPGKGWAVIETLGLGRVVGWSWLFPPYIWAFGAVTRQPTEAFQFDGPAVLGLCDADPALGYQLTHRFLAVLAHRLQAARMRLLEQWAPPEVWP
ncbi:MAG TPA: Crp/Fnr family transcriptional regulator [Streptosporangiaceae bacterium]